MAPERFFPDDPREWLNRAKSNLIQAKGEKPGVYWEDLCFQAQQAAEKSLKALLYEGLLLKGKDALEKVCKLVKRIPSPPINNDLDGNGLARGTNKTYFFGKYLVHVGNRDIRYSHRSGCHTVS